MGTSAECEGVGWYRAQPHWSWWRGRGTGWWDHGTRFASQYGRRCLWYDYGDGWFPRPNLELG
jgi:hypothetical protein